MVLLNVALISTSVVYLARNFVPMTKARNDALLSACSKLLEFSDSTTMKDNSYIETDSVRYLYLPFGLIYLIITTTMDSNVLEDLATLRMLQTVVQNILPHQVTPEDIEAKAFDLVFAFDECASFGYRENVTLQQIEQYIACDSHDERLQKMIRQSKEDEEKARRRKKAQELDRKRLVELRQSKALEKQRLATEAAHVQREVRAEIQSHDTGISSASSTVVDLNFDDGPSKNTRKGKGMKLGVRTNQPSLI